MPRKAQSKLKQAIDKLEQSKMMLNLQELLEIFDRGHEKEFIKLDTELHKNLHQETTGEGRIRIVAQAEASLRESERSGVCSYWKLMVNNLERSRIS